MIKGVGKKIVLLNNTESEIFEQAIFILRANDGVRHEDIIKECERMMNLHVNGKQYVKDNKIWKMGCIFLLFFSLALSFLCVLFAVN